MSEQNNGDKIEEQKPQESPKDYKVAEIWIKDGTVALDASPSFWSDKLRAVGVLHYCVKIVEDFNLADKKKIHIPQGLNGFRNIFRKKR